MELEKRVEGKRGNGDGRIRMEATGKEMDTVGSGGE
jgi:hypothetical protein